MLKLIDKFLKKIKTDRTTFFTYVLTLITSYIVVDRVVELLFMAFTGMSVSYWGPIKYCLAIACPWFAYFLAPASTYGKGKNKAKLTFFYVYVIAIYIIGISMAVQWLNHLAWIGILSVPNYKEIINNFSDLIQPALTSFAIYLPVVTFYPLLVWMHTRINDPIWPNMFVESISDYAGVDINPSRIPTGQYSYEINLCMDRSSGKAVKILDDKRYQSTLVVGPSGVRKNQYGYGTINCTRLRKEIFL